MGRKAIPTELKILRGNPGKRPLNEREPKPTKGVPEPLAGLSVKAKQHFTKLVEQLTAVRVLTVVDGPALSALAQSIADYEEASVMLVVKGKTAITERGEVRSPWAILQKQALDQMQRGFADFGLTPSARTRLEHLPVDDPEEESLFA
jgi:P27 family predicted phage terminase small subunit